VRVKVKLLRAKIPDFIGFPATPLLGRPRLTAVALAIATPEIQFPLPRGWI